MAERPSVSVIIPVYNRSRVVRDAVESVFMQTVKPLEIIVCDDGSSAPLRDFLQPYLSKIIYIRSDVNRGVSAARNAGIRQSRGEYVAFLDSDDIWLEDNILIRTQLAAEKNFALAHSNEFWFKNGRWINQGVKHKRYGGDIFEKVLDMCRVSPSSLMARRDIFDSVGFFDEDLRVCEDYEFILRASFRYPVMYTERELLVKRAFTGDQLSFSIRHIESIRLKILEKFAENHPEISGPRRDALEKELCRKRDIVKKGLGILSEEENLPKRNKTRDVKN